MNYNEIALMARVESESDLQPAGYLAANPDIQATGADPTEHFRDFGKTESRSQYQLSQIEAQRRAKLQRVALKRAPIRTLDSGALHFISDREKEEFNLPDHIPVAQNDYNAEIIALIRANPNAIILDVGAGLRHTCYSNVITTEIWASASADIICLGESLPFADEQFDFVICLAVLEHTVRPEIVCDEIVRVLKPGGIARIDWPFLQPVHGYPHHYFNATPQGAISRFEKTCDLISSEVKLWQHPVFSLTWILNEWATNLSEATRDEFRQLTVAHFLDGSIHDLVRAKVSSELSQDAQRVIAAGTTIDVRKR